MLFAVARWAVWSAASETERRTWRTAIAGRKTLPILGTVSPIAVGTELWDVISVSDHLKSINKYLN